MKKIMAVLLLIFTCLSLLGGAACHYSNVAAAQNNLPGTAFKQLTQQPTANNFLVHPLMIWEATFR